MNFRPKPREEPEINLIPFIDVLLVILIFLMLTTTYSKFTEMQIKLPVADTEAQRNYNKEVIVAISADGRYMVGKTLIAGRGVEAVADALADATQDSGKDTVVIISADADSTHQAVITVMEAARRDGLSRITFATQSSAKANAR